MQMDFGLPMLLSLVLSFAAYLALCCAHNPVNCPAIICLPRIAFFVFWERDITSEHHGTPVHISTTIYTHNLFPILLSSCSYYYTSLALILCKQQGRRD